MRGWWPRRPRARTVDTPLTLCLARDLHSGQSRIRGMRGARLLLVLVPFGIAAVAPGSVSRATRACAARSACAVGRLPAPITITTGRAKPPHRARRSRAPDGRAAEPLPARRELVSGDRHLASMLQRHHLVVGRRAASAPWRSRMQIASPWRLGVVAAGPHAVAFQAHHKLYLAPLGGVERAVARREFPLGGQRHGLYTYRYQGRVFAAQCYRPAGEGDRATARSLLDDYVGENGSLYFIARGAVMRAQGTRTELIASLKRLGLVGGRVYAVAGPLYPVGGRPPPGGVARRTARSSHPLRCRPGVREAKG